MPSLIELKLTEDEILEFVNLCYEVKAKHSIKQEIFNDEAPYIFYFSTGIRYLKFLYYKDTTERIECINEGIGSSTAYYKTRKIENEKVYEELKGLFDSMLVMNKLCSSV